MREIKLYYATSEYHPTITSSLGIPVGIVVHIPELQFSEYCTLKQTYVPVNQEEREWLELLAESLQYMLNTTNADNSYDDHRFDDICSDAFLQTALHPYVNDIQFTEIKSLDCPINQAVDDRTK